MLRIGIDGRPFRGNSAGTSRYGRELCRVLDSEFPTAQFIVYANYAVSMPVANERWTIRREHSSLWSKLPASLWYFERVGALAREDKLDLFWGGASLLPRGIERQCRSVVTVLDVVPALFPETMGWKNRWAHQIYFRRTLAVADSLVTISQGTARRLKQMFGRKPDEIVYPCASDLFVPPQAADVERVKKHYGLEEPFFLSVATLEPRKNLPALIQALVNLKASGVTAPALCLVGQVGWKTDELRRRIEQADEAGIRIVQTGFVPDEDLPALYAASSAFVFASVYEGFGMPVLEAIKCGARVLAADIPEIREAGGNQTTYFKPSVQGITETLRNFLDEDPSNQRLLPLVGESDGHDTSWKAEGRKLAVTMKSLL